MTTIRTVQPAEQRRALSVLVLAFATDPVLRWVWPDPDAYLRHFPDLLLAFGGGAFQSQTAHVADDFGGGSLWLPPKVGPDDEAIEAIVRETVADPVSSELLSIFEQMGESVPDVPHWHLAFVGVDPFRYGQGIGSALLSHGLEHVDEGGLPAYLESTNPRNLTLYQRHGFEVTREIRIGDAPPLFPMLRPPR